MLALFRLRIPVFWFFLLSAGLVQARQTTPQYIQSRDPYQSSLSWNVNLLSMKIAARTDAPSTETDLAYVDSIFAAALSVCSNDRLEALLALTFSLLPYNQVPVTFPLLGIRVNIPVYSAPETIFVHKNKKLPRWLFVDTPLGVFGDSDKPAHFFGSAFLSLGTWSYTASVYTGLFVEAFEEVFRSDGSVDVRDLRTNQLGYAFGKQLRSGGSLRPSAIFLNSNLQFFSWLL